MDNKQIASAIEFIAKLFNLNKSTVLEKVTTVAENQVAKPVPQVAVNLETEIDWSNPGSKIAKYFTVKDALLLRNWNRIGNEADGLNDTVKKNLVEVFKKMDIIREFLGVPVFVKSAWRPSAYNIAIGGAAQSAHMASVEFAAVDFWTDINGDGEKNGKDCDEIKAKLRPMLEQWGIRMEDNGAGATWVHIDTKPVPPGGHREFKP